MRLSKEQAAQNRQKIIDVAARRFRERGVDGIGVADVMSEAGFTHGGFYNHFESKAALAAAACDAAFAESLGTHRGEYAGDATPGTFERSLDTYLSPAHRDDATGGCPTASLAVDAWRQGDQVNAAYAAGVEGHLALIVAELKKTKPRRGAKPVSAAELRARAVRLLAEIVGALVLSRGVAGANATLSEEILRTCRERRGD